MNNSDIGYRDGDFRPLLINEKNWVKVSDGNVTKFETFDEVLSDKGDGSIMSERYYNSLNKK